MAIQRINAPRGGHSYKIDGEKADGVTTLIGDGLRKKALEMWGIKSVAEYVADNLEDIYAMRRLGRSAIVSALRRSPYEDRDAAARRGTEVHQIAEKLIHGEEVDVPEHLTGHVESYVKFLDEWSPKPVLVEATVASRKWGYCGTLDSVLDIPGHGRMIADIKTSRSGIYPETALQLAAYRFAEVYLDGDQERPMDELGIQGALGIWVRADGYDVLPVDAGEDQFRKFLHIAVSARWQKTSSALIGAPIRPGDSA